MTFKKRKRRWSRAEARRLSGGKHWIMGRESDEAILVSLGVTLGPKQVDDKGRVKRVKGLVVWGQCVIPNIGVLYDLNAQGRGDQMFMWGPDCPDHIAKDLVRERGHKVAEVDWDDSKFRKEVGADEESNNG